MRYYVRLQGTIEDAGGLLPPLSQDLWLPGKPLGPVATLFQESLDTILFRFTTNRIAFFKITLSLHFKGTLTVLHDAVSSSAPPLSGSG